jgi:uncharacterized protein DUF4430
VKRGRPAVAVAAALLVTALAACGIGPGEEGSGTVALTVTRDYGSTELLRETEQTIPSGETVMRLLQRRAKVETRYGGRFVNAIDGLGSGGAGAGGRDWFYYANGVEAEVGAADRDIAGGDRIWWDYHDWSAVMRVPAVVGSFPEPFIHGSEGKRFPVRIDCAQDAEDSCSEVAGRLEDAGISPSTTAIGAPAGEHVLRVLVGRWEDVRRDGAARQIEEGPDVSGVFARFRPIEGGYELELLDPLEHVAAKAGAGAGLVAATRFENQSPTWVVTGPDDLGLDRAIRLVSERVLRNRFAVAATARETRGLPVEAGKAK